jgi:hypothetical protein
MNADREEWMKQLHDLQEELKEERQHRKAFQAKVKDFSEEVYFVMLYNLQYFKDETEITQAGHRAMMNIHKIVGVGTRDMNELCPPMYGDPRSVRHHIVYKRAGITEQEYYTDQQDAVKDKKGEKLYIKQRAAGENFKLTTFDGTEK